MERHWTYLHTSPLAKGRRYTMPKRKSSHPGGAYLRSLRASRDMSQQQLADVIGYVTYDVIREIELQGKSPTAEWLLSFKQALELNSDEWRTLLAHYGIEVEPKTASQVSPAIRPLDSKIYANLANLL